jgi:AraC-like DNA-binding protein
VQYIGDSMMSFSSGDIVLVGANLPHYWKFDDSYFMENNPIQADVKVAHFSKEFFGDLFLNLPENNAIKCVLEKSKRGIRIPGGNIKVAQMLNNMLESEGTERIIYLMYALLEIAKCDKIELLSSIGFIMNQEENEKNRIKDIYEYSFANYKNKIHLEEIADVANISPNSFCRYFKSHTKKTYSQFLTEIKVGQACKLLIENNLNIKQVCYESGFNNFASFHKCFKSITGRSPLTYQKEFMAA